LKYKFAILAGNKMGHLREPICWAILSDKLKRHKCTAFAVVLEGHLLRDEDEIKATIN